MSNEDRHFPERQAAAFHSAGATVRHRSPFAPLPTPANAEPMSQEMVEKWVRPFYLQPLFGNVAEFATACAQATPQLTLSLLGEFDWRPRTVGARIIAVRQYFELQQSMSNLFLKSEVCYVGADYCVALASLGNANAAVTLCEYLDYYLRKPELWFDQGFAMAALLHLDEQRGTNDCGQFMEPWRQFISNKPNWDLADFKNTIAKCMAALQEIRQAMAALP